jgi:hypothetical protein
VLVLLLLLLLLLLSAVGDDMRMSGAAAVVVIARIGIEVVVLVEAVLGFELLACGTVVTVVAATHWRRGNKIVE